MTNNLSKLIFLLMLMTGTLITMSSSSWLSAWMGLEINLLSFIPLVSDSKNPYSTEASLKYFLTQAIASSILLFSTILLFNSQGTMSNQFSLWMVISSLLMKSGAAPFHFWFPNVMEGMTWMNSLILMTWQKLAPITLISYNDINMLLLISIMLCALIGAIGGLNQLSLRKLMAYSSINHMSWMFVSMYFGGSLWMWYFLFYSLISAMIIIMFKTYSLFHFNQIISNKSMSTGMKMMMMMNMFSLGGLPPFLGFIPKWMVIQPLIEFNQTFILFFLISMTLISLFYYMRLCYSSLMLIKMNLNWTSFMYNPFLENKFILMSYISSFGMTMMSIMYFVL